MNRAKLTATENVNDSLPQMVDEEEEESTADAKVLKKAKIALLEKIVPQKTPVQIEQVERKEAVQKEQAERKEAVQREQLERKEAVQKEQVERNEAFFQDERRRLEAINVSNEAHARVVIEFKKRGGEKEANSRRERRRGQEAERV